MASVDPDYDLAIQAYSEVWRRYENLGFDSLTEPEQTIFCSWQFVGEVNNGGIHQFFNNPSGEFAKETVGALERVKMPYAASLLKRALAAFFDPPKEHQTRVQKLWSLPENVQHDLFEALTGAFFDSSEDAYILQADYVRRNREFFLGLLPDSVASQSSQANGVMPPKLPRQAQGQQRQT